MPGTHTIEKIGGTSMTRFGEVMRNVILGDRTPDQLYQRVFVVSAYSGITNALLEDKKTGAPGVYAAFAARSRDWEKRLEDVRRKMTECNRRFEDLGLNQGEADQFVDQRIDGIKTCLRDLIKISSYGHLSPTSYLPATRELLAAAGEAHSAFNSVLILRKRGVNARFLDLTGWKEVELFPLEEMIRRAFREVDLAREMPIVTGYAKCDVGIMTHFDRGYSEITFSYIAAVTEAQEGIIHKEYHLSSGDPVLIGPDKVKVIGNTNFDIADEMSDMAMEAIHSKASKVMETKSVPIRVKNAFEPQHPGTLISLTYVSPVPRVEIICGREDILALEVYDPEMVGQSGYDHRLLGAMAEFGISYIAKNTNSNAITHYLPQKGVKVEPLVEAIKRAFPGAEITCRPVAVVALLGSNMKGTHFLARAATALDAAGIPVLGTNHGLRQVSLQFILEREDSAKAQLALHREFVESPS
jgi:aspartate kinase